MSARKTVECVRCQMDIDENEIGETGMCVPCEEETLEERTATRHVPAVSRPVAAKPQVTLQCQECGRTFKRAGVRHEYKCPKCGSYDIDFA